MSLTRTQRLKWRDLTGPEKLQPFKAILIDIPQLFPKIPHAVQEIWTEFLNIYLVLQSTTTTVDNERRRVFKVM